MDHSHHLHLLMEMITGDPLAISGFIAILSFSFLSSWHCGMMCCPLVVGMLGRGKSLSRRDVALYNAGRLVSYMGAGAILGAVGSEILAIGGWVHVLAATVVVGVLVLTILKVLNVSVLRILTARIGRQPRPTSQAAADPASFASAPARAVARLPEPIAALGLGVTTILLPCMTLTPVLTLASASGSALKGAALLGAFYLGTLAMMVIGPLMPNIVLRVNKQMAPKLGLIFLTIAALVTVARIWH